MPDDLKMESFSQIQWLIHQYINDSKDFPEEGKALMRDLTSDHINLLAKTMEWMELMWKRSEDR